MNYNIISDEQFSEIKNSLVNFIIRVTSQNEPKRDSEIAILPEITRMTLCYFGEDGYFPSRTA